MRSIDEIKADIENLKHATFTADITGMNIAAERHLALCAELRAAITDGIPLDELETMCAAWKDKRAVVDVRPDVATFARAMEETLRKHDDRPGWENESFCYLNNRLDEEWHELQRAPDSLNYRRELLDVANFCMMLYCNLTREAAEAALKGADNE